MLYELVTGRRPFEGTSPAQGIAAILHSHPAPVEPAAVNRVVQTCLAKDPDRRSGHLLFVRERTLVSQPFDTRRLRLEGEPVPIVDDIATHVGLYGAAYWTSDTGLLVYRTGSALERVRLMWARRDGLAAGSVGPEDAYTSFQLSPDGQRLVVGRMDPGAAADIWILEPESGRMTRVNLRSEGHRARCDVHSYCTATHMITAW